MTWSREFDAPIALPDGGELITLREAGEYVAALPAAEQNEPHWRTATLHLLSAAEHGGIVMLADIAMRQALGHERAAPRRGRKSPSVTESSDDDRLDLCRHPDNGGVATLATLSIANRPDTSRMSGMSFTDRINLPTIADSRTVRRMKGACDSMSDMRR